MSTEDLGQAAREVTGAMRQQERGLRSTVRALKATVVALVVLVLLLGFYVAVTVPDLVAAEADRRVAAELADADRRAADTARDELREAVEQLRGDVDDINTRRQERGLRPIPPPPPGKDELAAVVLRLVAAQIPSATQVAAQVTPEVLARVPDPNIPPQRLADLVKGAVAELIAADPPQDGQPGRPPTAEEIDTAVERYFEDNPPPAGPEGPPGPIGARGAPPLGWTTERADGTTETCRRADDFDPTRPRYECTTELPGGS